MATFKPLLIFMVTLITVFLFINLVISPIYQIEDIQRKGITGSLADTVENGFNLESLPFLGNTTIKPISWFYLGNQAVESFLINQLTYMSIIPSVILLPISIILIGSLGWTILIIVKDIIPFT